MTSGAPHTTTCSPSDHHTTSLGSSFERRKGCSLSATVAPKWDMKEARARNVHAISTDVEASWKTIKVHDSFEIRALETYRKREQEHRKLWRDRETALPWTSPP